VIFIREFTDTLGFHVYAVFDGHGLYGHLVSAWLKGSITKNLSTRVEYAKEWIEDEVLADHVEDVYR
jgi:serine/threonine protein phosphatase PrpC